MMTRRFAVAHLVNGVLRAPPRWPPRAAGADATADAAAAAAGEESGKRRWGVLSEAPVQLCYIASHYITLYTITSRRRQHE